MIGWLIAGVGLSLGLLVLLNWWANADAPTAKKSLFWGVVAVCGALGIILLVTGRGLFAIIPIGFAAWRMFGQVRGKGNTTHQKKPSRSTAKMSRSEALDALGLDEGASHEDITEAYKRLMSRCHPDRGGSDWMAAKLNEAKQTLLDR